MARAVVIVGGGVIGAALAWALARRGAAVTVVDAGGPRASDASFGWINAAPGNAGAYLDLRLAAMARWRDWAAALPLPVRWGGALTWEDQGPVLAAHAAALADRGATARLVDRDGVRALAPGLATPPDLALWCPDDGLAEAGRLAAVWRAAAADLGAAWVADSVLGVDPGGVRLAGGRIAADRVVVAAGLGSAALLPLDLHGAPGLIVQATGPGPDLAPLIAAPGLTLAQGPGGTWRAAGETKGSDPGGDPAGVAAALVRDLGGALGRPMTLTGWGVGIRPMPGDGLPLVGPCGPAYAAVMHSGVTLAPLIADLVAGEVMGGAPDPLLAAFRPDRRAP